MPNKNQSVITVPPALLHELLGKYSSLTPVELKVSALLTFNLSSSAVAEITRRSVRSIEFIQKKLRKKKNLQPSDN